MGKIFPSLFFIFMFFLLGTETSVSASGVEVIEMNDPFNIVSSSPYRIDYGDYDAYNIDISGTRAKSVTFSSYDESFTTVGTTKTYTAAQYGWQHFTGMGFNCNTNYIGELHDGDGILLVRIKMKVTGLQKPACDSEPSGEMGGGDCDVCGIFDCPGWSEFTGQLDDIKNAIPPAPNWHEVSQIFSNTIVPALVNDTRVMLDDLLGRAPSPPTPPPQQQAPPNVDKPANVDDFVNKEPEMQDSGVEGFDKDQIKNEAPELQYEEDDTGGFDLSVHPVDSLPDVVPGGDPGIYKRDPEMMDAEMPKKPKESGEEVGGPGKPKEDFGNPGNPSDNVGNPSNPDDNIGNPSNPSGEAKPPNEYMPKPK